MDALNSRLTHHLIQAANDLDPSHPNYKNYHGKIERAEVLKGMCIIFRGEEGTAHRRIPPEFVDGKYTEDGLKELAESMMDYHCTFMIRTGFKAVPEDPDNAIAIGKTLACVGKVMPIEGEDYKVLDAFIDPESDGSIVCLQLLNLTQPRKLSLDEIRTESEKILAEGLGLRQDQIRVTMYRNDDRVMMEFGFQNLGDLDIVDAWSRMSFLQRHPEDPYMQRLKALTGHSICHYHPPWQMTGSPTFDLTVYSEVAPCTKDD